MEKQKGKLEQGYEGVVCYDYLLSKIVREGLEGEQINRVKEKIGDKQRWRNLVGMVVGMDRG